MPTCLKQHKAEGAVDDLELSIYRNDHANALFQLGHDDYLIELQLSDGRWLPFFQLTTKFRKCSQEFVNAWLISICRPQSFEEVVFAGLHLEKILERTTRAEQKNERLDPQMNGWFCATEGHPTFKKAEIRLC